MKIRGLVCNICEKCRPIHRRQRIIVICSNPRHKQRRVIFLKFYVLKIKK
ncbi:hypothetical protein AMTRI_Chr07g26720 [Amborella trichopoda]